MIKLQGHSLIHCAFRFGWVADAEGAGVSFKMKLLLRNTE